MASNNVINAPIPFSVPNGGTGNSTLTTPYGVLTAGTTATGPVQTVSPGTSGQVLTSGGPSALPSFQNAPGAVLAFATASGGATVDFANVFSSAYEIYLCVFENYLPSAGNTVLSALFGTGATPTYQTSGYFGNLLTFSAGSAVVTNPTASLTLFSGQYGVAHFEANGYFYIFNVNNSPSSISINGMTNYWDHTAPANFSTAVSMGWQGANPVTSLRFIPATGNIATGNFYLYGLNP